VPELPEVETVRRKLEPVVVGRRIARVETTRKSYFFLTPPAVLAERLPGRRVAALVRLGKYLELRFDDGSALLLHLGMTGQLFVEGAKNTRLLKVNDRRQHQPATPAQADEHTHLVLRFSDRGPSVVFRDVRKFGKCALVAPGKRHPRLARLGKDALAIDGPTLFEATRRRRVAVKSVLLDQSVLAGVGNIYADEALHRAGIRPTRRATRLGVEDCERLAASIRAVLGRAIELGGSSISDYLQPDGSDGGFQHERRVYGRGGQPCRKCKTPIARIVIGQRSTHYCPSCQH
jgi:formamidopyrimidine-DNA glycosylase